MDNREIQQASNPYQGEDEISLKELIQKIKELFQYFWTFRFWILVVGLTGGAMGFVYAQFFKEVQYTSKLTFAIEEKGGGGGWASSARQVRRPARHLTTQNPQAMVEKVMVAMWTSL